jgi:hypothetical protein
MNAVDIDRRRDVVQQAGEVNRFLETYRRDEALQREYLQNPSRFLAEIVPQREYAFEVQALESRLASESRTALDKAVLHPELSARTGSDGMLSAGLPGGAEVTFEATMGTWSAITGYYLVLNEKATTDVVNGLTTAGTLAGLIAGANPEVLSKATAAGLGPVGLAGAWVGPLGN